MIDVSTAPIEILPTLYFIRVYGELRQVHPLTRPHKYNGWNILAKFDRTGQIVQIHDRDIIRYTGK